MHLALELRSLVWTSPASRLRFLGHATVYIARSSQDSSDRPTRQMWACRDLHFRTCLGLDGTKWSGHSNHAMSSTFGPACAQSTLAIASIAACSIDIWLTWMILNYCSPVLKLLISEEKTRMRCPWKLMRVHGKVHGQSVDLVLLVNFKYQTIKSMQVRGHRMCQFISGSDSQISLIISQPIFSQCLLENCFSSGSFAPFSTHLHLMGFL